MKKLKFRKVTVETIPLKFETICINCNHKFVFTERDVTSATMENNHYHHYTYVECPKCKEETHPTGYHSLTTKKPLTITTYYH